jgi:hypothetical protein
MAKSGPAPQIVTSYHFTPAPFLGTLTMLLRECGLMSRNANALITLR